MNYIAIFGARGYLGRQLAFFFNRRGDAIDEYDMPECDVTGSDFWNTFEPQKYSAVLFFSGLTGTEKGFTEAIEYTSVNELGLLRLLMKLAPHGKLAPRVIFPSTRLVYKGSDLPCREDAPKAAKTVYAVNKLACEGFLAAYSNRFGIPYNVVRICVPYGSLTDGDYSFGTIGFFLRQISAGETIKLFGNGSQGRTFTHVEDICYAVETIAKGGKNGVYNIGGDALSLKEAAELVALQNHGRVSTIPWPAEARAIESGGTVFDATKMERDFGFRPIHSLREDVKEIKAS